MALSQTKIEFAVLSNSFRKAYIAKDELLMSLYACQLNHLLVTIACGGVAL
jgi:hypothetical protein